MNEAQNLIREMAHKAINMLYVCDPDSDEWHYAIHALGQYSDWYEYQTDLPEDFHVNFDANIGDSASDSIDDDTEASAEAKRASWMLRSPNVIWYRTSLSKPHDGELVVCHTIDHAGRHSIITLYWNENRQLFYQDINGEGFAFDTKAYKFWARINMPGDQ